MVVLSRKGEHLQGVPGRPLHRHSVGSHAEQPAIVRRRKDRVHGVPGLDRLFPVACLHLLVATHNGPEIVLHQEVVGHVWTIRLQSTSSPRGQEPILGGGIGPNHFVAQLFRQAGREVSTFASCHKLGAETAVRRHEVPRRHGHVGQPLKDSGKKVPYFHALGGELMLELVREAIAHLGFPLLVIALQNDDAGRAKSLVGQQQ
mmetsp:Transcript_22141/g.52630  ORF Transcript_22141/g.52630 Transcript_22141/m.52630 type:complete len:203 (-) Transcript_22141:562-1170(-)